MVGNLREARGKDYISARIVSSATHRSRHLIGTCSLSVEKHHSFRVPVVNTEPSKDLTLWFTYRGSILIIMLLLMYVSINLYSNIISLYFVVLLGEKAKMQVQDATCEPNKQGPD